MSDCENFNMQQLRRMQELQQKNEELAAQLAAHKEMLDRRLVSLAELEEKCQALSAELEATKKSERWIRRECEMLAAQMKIVHLIFGARQGGGCGGCH